MPQLKESPKPSGQQATYQSTLKHLIWMAGLKGAKHYAWDRAKKLEAEPTGAWAGIVDDLTKAMNEKCKDGQEPDGNSQNPTSLWRKRSITGDRG